MVDSEVSRLRGLRRAALRERAVCRALGRAEVCPEGAVLRQARCASWRIARTVSGRLRAHPYAVYQRDERLVALLADALAGRVAAARCSTRAAALARVRRGLGALARELDDARALTRCADLSDALGRSQLELRDLLRALASPAAPRARSPAGAPGALNAPAGGQVAVADWPYVHL